LGHADDQPKGDAADPLTRDEIRDKLRLAAEGTLSRAAVDETLAACDELERLADVRELLARVQAPARVT